LHSCDPLFIPDKAAAWGLGGKLSQAARAQSKLSVPALYLAQNDTYLFQAANPQYIPDPAALNRAYLANAISLTQWECLTRSHGFHTEPAYWNIAAESNRPIVSDLVSLYLRGSLTLDQLRQRCREMGVLNTGHVSEWLRLREYVPGPSDLVRFMVRDAADPAVVEEGNLSKDFETKFYGPGGRDNPGPMAKWALAQGMDESQFRFYWHSHWEYPSNTALYEMVHRLRPDRPEVSDYRRRLQEWEDAGKPGEPPAKPLIVAIPDARRVLEINDMAPRWVDPLLAISYHPITRTDAIDAYMSGAYSADDLYHAMRDNGYDDENARRLVRIQSAKLNRRLSNATGVLTARKVISAYKEGVIDRMTADARLSLTIVDQGQRTQLLSSADEEVAFQGRRSRLNYWRRGYFTGNLSADQVAAEMEAAGMAQSRTGDLIAQWEFERKGRFREPAVRLILKWSQLGIITPADAYTRVRNLGYSDIDAQRIVYTGIVDRVTYVRGEMKKAEKELKDRFNAKAKLSKETQEELEKRLEQIEEIRKKIEAELKDRIPTG
jgi:hypothetical protein